MKFSDFKPDALTLNISYDPFDVAERVDGLKITRKGLFGIYSIFEGDVVVLSDTERKTTCTIRSSHLTLTFEDDKPFGQRDLEIFKKLIPLLLPLRIRGMWVALSATLTLEDVESASAFVRDTFFKTEATLEKELGGQIISAGARIYYGSPEDHYEVMLDPETLSGFEVGLRLRHRRDVDVKDKELLFGKVKDLLDDTLTELEKIKSLW